MGKPKQPPSKSKKTSKKKPAEPRPKRTPSQSSKLAKAKGSQWERDCANLFKRLLGGLDIKRGLGQARAAGEVPDVNGVPGLWIECKVGDQTNPRAALIQALTALNDPKAPPGSADKIPIAVCKDDGKPPFVCMYLDDFSLLLKEWWFKNRRRFEEDSHAPAVDSEALAAGGETAEEVADEDGALAESEDEQGDGGEDAGSAEDAA